MTNDDQPSDAVIEAQVDAFLATWFAVRQYVQGLNFNRAHQHGLSTTQFLVLGFLDATERGEPATVRWLSARLSLDPATVVRTVDSLEQRGLVVRRRDTHDRRRVFVEFTDEGRAMEIASRQRFRHSVAATFRTMSASGRVALISGLEEFVTIGKQIEGLIQPDEAQHKEATDGA